jgi:hypothetical protein
MAQRAVSGTLVADTVTTVKFTQYFWNLVVVNRSTNQEIWVRTDGEDPTVTGDDCFPVLPQQSVTFSNGSLSQEPVVRTGGGTQVSIISSGTPPYSVWAAS